MPHIIRLISNHQFIFLHIKALKSKILSRISAINKIEKTVSKYNKALE